jgi:uncharacterized flavoprotein (TIGR03862 family)
LKVTVVGSVPAGLSAAETLAEGGAKVTIIDHHASPSRKFLLAGRGGLNLTHSDPLEKLLMRYGAARAKLEPMIRAFPPEALRNWCHGLGIETFVGSSGRVFPRTMKASPVLRAWLRKLESLGVELQLNQEWHGFNDTPTILALGGASWPELGSTGAWRDVFLRAGVEVLPFRASNVRQPVAWSGGFAEKFSGQPARGELMVAHDGIEGGAIYALSAPLQQSRHIEIDLKPDLTAAVVAARLARPRGKQSRSNFYRKALNLSPPAIALMREANSDNPKQVTLQLGAEAELRRAISTAGGVAWHEVDDDLSLRKFPFTFVA